MKHIFNSMILLFVLVVSQSKAQQIPVNNFYLQNSFVFNPAALGNEKKLSACIDYANQWTGLKTAPEVGNVGVYGLFTDKMGAGIHISHQKHGIFRQMYIDAKYAYNITFSAQHTLGLGVSVGVQQNRTDVDDIEHADLNDPLLTSNKFNEILLNSGFGLQYQIQHFSLQVSLPILYGTQENTFGKNIFALAAYDILLQSETWKITPSVLYRNSHKELHVADINATTTWKNKLWLQLGYRTNGDILSSIGVNLQNINLGYAYTFDRSHLNIVSSGSHQIFIKFGIISFK